MHRSIRTTCPEDSGTIATAYNQVCSTYAQIAVRIIVIAAIAALVY